MNDQKRKIDQPRSKQSKQMKNNGAGSKMQSGHKWRYRRND